MARQQNSAHTLAPPLQEETLPVADIEDVDVQTDELPATTGQSGPTTAMNGQADVQAEEVSFDEQFYPARPRRLRPRARLRLFALAASASPGRRPAVRRQPATTCTGWSRSRCWRDANAFATQFSGQGSMWQNPFANPDPRAAIEKASVWFTAYPISMITKPGPLLPRHAGRPGPVDRRSRPSASTAIHTGPVKRAGGLERLGRRPRAWTATSTGSAPQIDDAFGTEEEFRAMCEVAAAHGGTVIDDIVPGPHRQGRGLPARRDEGRRLPGHLPHGRDPRGDWHLLPKVARGRDSVNLDPEAEDRLAEGRLHHRPAAAGDLLRARASRTPTGAPPRRCSDRTAWSAAGSTCTTSRRASPRSTGWTRPSPACGW